MGRVVRRFYFCSSENFNTPKSTVDGSAGRLCKDRWRNSFYAVTVDLDLPLYRLPGYAEHDDAFRVRRCVPAVTLLRCIWFCQNGSRLMKTSSTTWWNGSWLGLRCLGWPNRSQVSHTTHITTLNIFVFLVGGFHHVGQDGLGSDLSLPAWPQCWDYRCDPSLLGFLRLHSEELGDKGDEGRDFGWCLSRPGEAYLGDCSSLSRSEQASTPLPFFFFTRLSHWRALVHLHSSIRLGL